MITSQGQTIEKVVDAPDEGAATHRALQAFQGQQFVQTTVSQIDPGLNIPTNKASQQNIMPKQLATLQPLKQLAQPSARRESIDSRVFNYPYSITLPSQFKKILHETSPVKVNEMMGQLYIILEGKEEMRNFLERLKISHDHNLARIIVTGIRSSIS